MKALILADGTMEGWVGGNCTHPIVVREALVALGGGAPRLICLAPEGQDDGREGVIRHLMTCHSGGTLEIYIEPVLPKPQLLLIGEAPLVSVLSDLGRLQGFGVWVAADASKAPDLEPRITSSSYVVVATMGTSDEEALERVVGHGAAYVALVSSRKRAEAVFAYLRSRGVSPAEVQRIKVPAGLDIGAITPEEIALSIMAEVIQVRRAGPGVQTEVLATVEATDPICGMAVEVATAKHKADYGGTTYYFCSAHCKATFERDPEKYAMAQA
jgi:xanthine dehydrogenase accessory factor